MRSCTLTAHSKTPSFPELCRLERTDRFLVASQNEKTTLLGKTKQDYAQIVRWMSFGNAHVLPHIGSWFRPLVGRDPYNKANVEKSQHNAEKALYVLEQHLLVHTYLVGERITLADLFMASMVLRGFEYVLDKRWRDEHPNTTRWYETVTAQPIWRAAVSEVKMCDEAVKYTPPKKEPKAAKVPAAAAASTPKAAKKPAQEEEDEEEDAAKPEPKPKHPLEALSKPTLILDDWKRKYSNEDTRPVALPWFWENYKEDEYSLWRVDYKYNDELTLTFMSNNLIGKPSSRLRVSLPLMLSPTNVLLHARWIFHPPRSLTQVPLRRRQRLWHDQRLHHPGCVHSARRGSSAGL